MEENYREGRLYGLNVMFGPPVCYYNKDLFLKAGLDDPYTQWRQGRWTWESFVHAAQALTVRDPNGRALRYGFLMPGALGGAPPHWAWFVWLWGEGGALLSAPDPSRPRVSLFDTPEALAAFGAMRDLRFKKCVTPTLTDGAASAFTFESGKVGMEFSFSGSAPRYRNITDFKWDIAPIPYRVTAREGRRTVVPYALVKGNQLVVSANSPNPRAAWEFVKYATSYEAERILYGDTHRRNVPTRLNLLSSREDYIKASRPPYHIDIYKDLLDCGMELPIDYAWPAWTSEAARHLEKLFVDPDADLQQVLRTTKIAVDRVLAAEFERMKRYVKKEPDAR
jgi:multiple sugar transport system substrate-binding protein